MEIFKKYTNDFISSKVNFSPIPSPTPTPNQNLNIYNYFSFIKSMKIKYSEKKI